LCEELWEKVSYFGMQQGVRPGTGETDRYAASDIFIFLSSELLLYCEQLQAIHKSRPLHFLKD